MQYLRTAVPLLSSKCKILGPLKSNIIILPIFAKKHFLSIIYDYTHSRTVTFCDISWYFLQILEKIRLKTLLYPKYSRTVTLFLTFFCNSPGVSTVCMSTVLNM